MAANAVKALRLIMVILCRHHQQQKYAEQLQQPILAIAFQSNDARVHVSRAKGLVPSGLRV